MRKYTKYLVALIVIVALWFTISPPRFWVNLIHNVQPTAEVGAALVQKHDCRNCHRIEDTGALVGPDLDKILTHKSTDEIERWLRNPRAMNPNTPMPNYHFSDTEIAALLAYLKTLNP